MGAGDQLTLSQYMRELDKLAKKEKDTELTDEENARVYEIEKLAMDLMANCFDDQEGGEKARALVYSLTPEELAEIMIEIFKEAEDGTEVS